METVSKILEYNQQKLSKILAGVVEYYKNIEKVVQVNNSPTHDKFITTTTRVDKTISGMKIDAQTLEEIASFYDSFDSAMSDIDYIISVVNDPYYTKLHVINMSQTFIDNIHKRKSVLLDEYEEFKEKTIDNNDTIYKIMFRGFDYSKNKTEVNKLLLKYKNNINKFIIALVDRIYSGNDPMLQTYIEGMKNITLGGDELAAKGLDNQRYLDNKSVGYINYILGRNNLAPITGSMPIGQLLSVLNGAKYSDGVTGVESAVKLIKSAGLKHDVWIIIKHVLTPLEFDIRPLVNKQYLIDNGLYLPVDHVLNDAMIKKTNTNYMLNKKTDSETKLEQRIIRVEADSSKCYIIESLVPDMYRLLSNTGDYLSNQLETNLNSGSVIRPMLYNNIINEEIIAKKGFKNHTALVNKFRTDYKSTSLPADTVMSKVKEELRNQVEKLIQSDKHKTESEFIALATDTSIIASAINKVLPMKESDGGSRQEYTITYLIRINDIAFELTKRFTSALIEKGVRKFYKNMNTLQQICFEAIDIVVASMNKTGKWSNFEYSFKEFVLDNEFIIM
jgi:hypothetical protein